MRNLAATTAYLDSLPTAAPEVLRWLLSGPLTFDQITERRRARLAAALGDALPPGVPVRSVLYDLHALDLLVSYAPGTGTFHLNPSAAEAVRAHARTTGAVAGPGMPGASGPGQLRGRCLSLSQDENRPDKG